MASHLSGNCYGKHQVRVSKIRRTGVTGAKHEFIEASVNIELEGDFDAAFTDGNNQSVVATDTCKNTVYILAKDTEYETIETFTLAIAKHFIGRYDHVSQARISASEQIWDRILDSDHAFAARDKMTPTAEVLLVRGEEPKITSGLKHLTIAKTTESGFVDFHDDDFRTLPDTDDRILATEMAATWEYDSAKIDLANFDFAVKRAEVFNALLARFIDHYSRSVQETLYFMGQAAIEACADINSITLTMPNKHHLLANLKPFNRENKNEIFVVTDEPFGYISGTVSRS